jgi:Ni,Fe-hydrogenase I cytochrome b subunit
MTDRLKPWIGMLAILALCILGFYAVQAYAEDRCQRKGGHLVSVYKGWICVSADGRVIE